MADEEQFKVEMRVGGRQGGKVSELWGRILGEWLASQDFPEERRLSLLCHPDDLRMRTAELRLIALLHPEWRAATVAASPLVLKGAVFAVENRHLARYLGASYG